MGVKYWVDTSAILHNQDIFKNKKILISTLTLQELEHILSDHFLYLSS